MGGKSDQTKYVTELAVLGAFILPKNIYVNKTSEFIENIEYSKISNFDLIENIKKYLPIALDTGGVEYFNQILINSRELKTKIYNFLDKASIPLPTQFDWQGNNNNNSNKTPADVLFVNHPLEGISVKKDGGLNGFNLGINDLGILSNEKNALDILSNNTYSELVNLVKQDVINCLDKVNLIDPDGRNKYTIKKIDKNLYEIKLEKNATKFTLDEILKDDYSQKNNRVFGDYFQKNKNSYQEILNKISAEMNNSLPALVEEKVFTNKETKLRCGYFQAQPYFYIDTNKNNLYYVPSADEIKDQIEITVDKNRKTKYGGSGQKVYLILTNKIDNTKTTVEWHIRQHAGTFCGNPVNMIQGIKNPENIWKKLN